MISRRYTGVAIILHWVIAVAILGQISLGLYMTRLGNSQIGLKFALYQFHKSVGISILALTLARLVWRLLHKPPPASAGQPAWERRAAHATHLAFYAFMIGLPLTGWIIVSSTPLDIPTVLFGVVPLPNLPGLNTLSDSAGISATFADIHAVAAYFLLATVVLHIAAALKHHMIDRDEVLWRMLPLPAIRRRMTKDIS